MPEAENAAPDKGSTADSSGQKAAVAGGAVPAADEIAKLVDHAVGSRLGGLIKKQLEEQLPRLLKAGEPAKDKPAPTDEPPDDKASLALKEIEVLKRVNAEERAAREKAERRARDQSLKAGIRDALAALDGRDGKPKLNQKWTGDLATLIEGGSGLHSRPELDDEGRIVVKDATGQMKPLAEILGNGYFGKEHWALDRFSTTGSGSGRGAMNGAASTAETPRISTPEGLRAFREKANENPDEAIAIARKQMDEAASRLAQQGRMTRTAANAGRK